MAISGSYKQPCPSCEALVLIKDHGLIGKKISCPTCKYKFEVQEPADNGAGTDGQKKSAVKGARDKEAITARGKAGASRTKPPSVPADDPDNEAKARRAKAKKPARSRDDYDEDDDYQQERGSKKKKSGPNMFVVGIALAGVGVVVLVVAAFFVLSGGSNTPSGDPRPVGPAPNDLAKPPDLAQPVKPNQLPGQKDPGKPAQALAATSELTNLLPNDTEHVFHVFFKNLMDVQNPFRKAAFDTPGSFVDQQMRSRLGFSPLAIDDLIRAERYTGSPWAFTVIHCTEKLNLAEMQKALDLKPATGSPVKQRPFFEAKINPWLDQFARMSFGVPVGQRTLTTRPNNRPMFVHLHNDQTVIFADYQPLLAFLQADGKFKLLSESFVPVAQPGQPNPPPGGPPPGVAPPEGMPPGGMPPPMGTQPMGPPPATMPGGPGIGGDPAQPPPGGPPQVETPAGPRYEPYMTIQPKLKAMLERMETIADVNEKVLLSSATDLKAARLDGKQVPGKERVFWHFRQIWDATQALREIKPGLQVLGTTMLMLKKERSYQYRNELECAKGKETEAKELQKELQDKVAPQIVKLFERFLGHKIELAKAETPPNVPGMPPGTEQPPMVPMQPPMPVMPPNAGDPNMPPMEKKEELENSRLQVTRKGIAVEFKLDLLLEQPAYNKLASLAELFLCGLKGETDLAMRESPRHPLSRAARLLAEKGLSEHKVPPGTYPPGAFARPANALRSAREPQNRISWMAGLLPFLGQENLYEKIHFEASWKDQPNWLAARTLVTQFQDPTYPDEARYIYYPGPGLAAAATHFVGIAGVGLDAADYPPGDPAVEHKRGVFGYDQSLRLEDVKAGRGLSNTILLIQVPHEGLAGVTPWLAGGGSTVRGVPDKNSVAPFVLGSDRDGKPITYNGRRGTFALMTDGSVRFIDKDVGDDVFKAMCTVKGPAPDTFNPAKDKKTPLVEETKGSVPTPLPGGTKGTTPQPKVGPPPVWIKFTSPEGKFSILFPKQPQTAQVQLPSPTGPVTMTNHTVVSLAEKQGFTVTYFDIPKDDKIPLEQRFDGAKQGMLLMLAKGKGALVRKEQPVTLGKNPGREYVLDVGGTGTMIVRLFLVGNRFFSLIVAGETLAPDGQEVKTFFASFQAL